MAGFTKFDPRDFLESEEPRPPHAKPAKAAKPAEACNGPNRTLATLATLAASRGCSQDPATLAGDDDSAELLAPVFKPLSPADGEPGFSEPCATRIGRVEHRPNGLFLHFCGECGAWGAFGYDVSLRAGRLGRWYCADHRPQSETR